MTDDLVKRLRDVVGPRVNREITPFVSVKCSVIDEAADEIERLRAKLQEIYNLHHNDDCIFIRDDVTYEIVCEALEMKDE